MHLQFSWLVVDQVSFEVASTVGYRFRRGHRAVPAAPQSWGLRAMRWVAGHGKRALMPSASCGRSQVMPTPGYRPHWEDLRCLRSGREAPAGPDLSP